jgi:hypothetical protein
MRTRLGRKSNASEPLQSELARASPVHAAAHKRSDVARSLGATMKSRVMTMLLIVATMAACQRSAERGVSAGRELGSSEHPLSKLGVDSLTDRQRCFIREFERDSLPGAACMAPCIRDGSGYGIGGGCWHLCYAYTRVVIPRPERFAHCPDAGPEPVSPRPVVTCTSAPGKREIRVRFVDAATNAPIRSGMLLRPSSSGGLARADSLGAVSMPITGTVPIQYMGHARGFAYMVDTISVEQNSVCDVLVRLTSARGHGF